MNGGKTTPRLSDHRRETQSASLRWRRARACIDLRFTVIDGLFVRPDASPLRGEAFGGSRRPRARRTGG